MKYIRQSRQAMILEIIARQNIETQEQLLDCLRDAGINATQATISRDIKQLHLIKEPIGQGVYRYAVSGSGFHVAEKLRRIFRESVLSVDCAQNLVILKTMPGLASAACSALDNMDAPDMVGSIAGDDTAFLAMRDAASAAVFRDELKEMMKPVS